MAARTKTRWLGEDEQQTWRAFLYAMRLLIEQLDRELQQDAGMPHGYYEILVALSEAPDRTMRMSQLAELTRSSRSRLSHAVDRLEEAGWVVRRACGDDRRGQWAVMTDKGFKAIEAAAPRHVEGVRQHVFDRLTPEQTTQLGEISRAILDGLTCPPPPVADDAC